MKKSLIATSVITSLVFGLSAFGAEQERVTSSIDVASQVRGVSANKVELLKSQLKLDNRYGFIELKQIQDQQGNVHSRFQQTYKNIPVWGQTVTHHSLQKNSKMRLTGEITKKIESDLGDNVTPQLTVEQVLNHTRAKAVSKLGNLKERLREHAELVVFYDPRFNKAHLAYHVEMYGISPAGKPTRHMFIVDANSGSILKNWNALMHLDATGPGGNLKTGRYEYGIDYTALDVTDDGAGNCSLENENVKAIDLNHEWDTANTTAFEFSCPENTHKEVNGAYSPINDAFFFGNLTFDMYNEWYGVSPLPFQLSMKVHFGTAYENAFWDGQAMTFGDGDAYFYPLVDVNVSVHEVSHGFTDFNSDLIYSNQSGGMNEAFSDIAGEAAEFYWRGQVDWFIGSDIFKNGDGLRYFEDPTMDGRSIAHFEDYYDGMDVHFSSGIYNRAYYVLANMEGWDPKKAFDIFVLANQAYWVANDTFAGGACGLMMAADDLGYDWLDVHIAMDSVGVACESNAIDEDNDGMSDISELMLGFDPANPADGAMDFDNDGISNRVEINQGFDPKDRDTDNDGLIDGEEYISLSTSVTNSDSDNDSMPDGWEYKHGFNPLSELDAAQDADGDGYTNIKEYAAGTDPLDANSYKVPNILRSSVYDFEDGLKSEVFEEYPNAYSQMEVTNTDAFDSNYSLSHMDISDSQFAATIMNITSEEGEFVFDLRTSTESGWDYFQVYIDGGLAYELSGINDWRNVSLPITAGAHQIILAYVKDGSVSSGEDTIWVDNIYYAGMSFDSDDDSMVDAWELAYGLDPNSPDDAAMDLDQDGMTNLEEYNADTNPALNDTDGDGLSDYEEINDSLTNPLNRDSDGDGISDGLELSAQLDPLDSADATLDLDQDGFTNVVEAKYGTALDNANETPAALTYLFEDFSGELSEQWSSNGAETWFTDSFADRGHVLISEPISNSKTAIVTYTNVFQAGTLSFDVFVDSELDVDFLYISVNGENQVSLSGESVAQKVTFELAQGENVIEFSYSKNQAKSSAIDRVMIDHFEFIAPDFDSDNDGLSNSEEVELGTNLGSADSDNDGLNDGDEISLQTDPLNADSDHDGLNDGDEINTFDTDPLNGDSDQDGVTDGLEVLTFNTDPMSSDSDDDGLTDGQEINELGTNPLASDSDGDGLSDAEEIAETETNPLLADTDGDGVNDKVDVYPNDASRWKKKSGGSVGYLVLVLLGLSLRRKLAK